ncbi:MAG TPA: hypothetical protein VHN14_32180 [Kofleriaceae bacterium]|jgi:hypothetical protein|nr:hypothetical protein [Kofleriaceae bacterium]
MTVIKMAPKLKRFREYMARLNTTDPLYAMEHKFYVPSPGRTVADRIFTHVSLQPAASLAVVGGIGSGKTTQLLVAQKKLAKVRDTATIYVDVSAHQHLGKLKPGVLLVLAGLQLAKLVGDVADPHVQKAIKALHKAAAGYTEYYDPNEYDPSEYDDYPSVDVPAAITPPVPPLESTVEEYLEHVKMLRAALTTKSNMVVLFDSLDRLSDLDLFAMIVEQDVRALKEANIGVVVVGPLRVIFGAHRTTLERFDEYLHLPTIDAEKSPEGLKFLTEVLTKRVPPDALEKKAAAAAAVASGGVLRDLLSIGRSAGERAFMLSALIVDESHVAWAADEFGRRKLFGASPEEIEILQRVRKKGTFASTSDQDLALLVTGRVLEYVNGQTRFSVHPTIRPLLADMAKGKLLG